jgi:hypothetical protein
MNDMIDIVRIGNDVGTREACNQNKASFAELIGVSYGALQQSNEQFVWPNMTRGLSSLNSLCTMLFIVRKKTQG